MKRIFNLIVRYRDAFKNWYSIMLFRAAGMEVIRVIPRGFENEPELKFRVSKNREPDGMLVQNFSPSYYSFISGKCHIAVDIGGSIGDSSILLLMRGANKVISLEPNVSTFSIAKENIERNGMEDRITILNAGYGEDGVIKIKNVVGDPNNKIEFEENGREIPVLSLKSIINKYFNQYESASHIIAFLKVSCAGCEMNLLNEDDEVLRIFSKVQIKFEAGYLELWQKFEKLGYLVRISFIDYPLRGWLYIEKPDIIHKKLISDNKNVTVPLDEFMTQYSSILRDHNIPLVQTPEFNFSFNQFDNYKPDVSLTYLSKDFVIFSILTYNKHKVMGITIIEANIRGGPIIIKDDVVLNYCENFNLKAYDEKIKEHLNFTLNHLKNNKIDFLTLEPLEIWKNSLDPIFTNMSFFIHKHCDLFLSLPNTEQLLFESYKRLAKRKINLALKSEVLVEEVPLEDLEKHLSNLGKLWKEMWLRSGKDYDSTVVRRQVMRLYRSGIAKIFSARIENDYIAYRVILIDKAYNEVVDFLAPSSKKAYETGANYLLVYNAMLYAVKNNYYKWAFWGINCNPEGNSKEEGIYRFKSSFVQDVNQVKIECNIFRRSITVAGKLFVYFLERRVS